MAIHPAGGQAAEAKEEVAAVLRAYRQLQTLDLWYEIVDEAGTAQAMQRVTEDRRSGAHRVEVYPFIDFDRRSVHTFHIEYSHQGVQQMLGESPANGEVGWLGTWPGKIRIDREGKLFRMGVTLTSGRIMVDDRRMPYAFDSYFSDPTTPNSVLESLEKKAGTIAMAVVGEGAGRRLQFKDAGMLLEFDASTYALLKAQCMVDDPPYVLKECIAEETRKMGGVSIPSKFTIIGRDAKQVTWVTQARLVEKISSVNRDVSATLVPIVFPQRCLVDDRIKNETYHVGESDPE